MSYEVIYRRGETRLEDIQLKAGERYQFVWSVPDWFIAKWYQEHVWWPTYGKVLFGSDRKAQVRIPFSGTYKRAIIYAPEYVGAEYRIDVELIDNPISASTVAFAVVVLLGLVGSVFFLMEARRLVEVSGGGEILKGIGEALKSAASGGWLTPVLLIGALVTLVLLLPRLVTSGKRAVKLAGS